MTQEWLVYTEEDLVALTNRGTVKRATREFEEEGLTATFVHTEQTLEVHWSDQVSCVFVAQRPLSEVYCSCPAAHLCRHVVRSVLAIQKSFAENVSKDIEGPWNPGDITDSSLLTMFSKDAFEAAKRKIEDGIVVELHPGSRPSARLLTDEQTVLFRLRTDLSSASCTCAKASLCDHLLLAVMAFRLKHSDGVELITTQDESPLEDELQALLQRVENTLFSLLRVGFARADSTSIDRLQNLANTLNSKNLRHNAEVLEDIITQLNLYFAHDSRFNPSTFATLLGEFAIRHDALKAQQIPIPRFFIRGKAPEQALQIGQGRLTGLGCLCEVSPNGVTMRAVLFDTMAARIVEIHHFFENLDDDRPPDFSNLARRLVFAGRGLDTFARGQIVARQTQISSAHRLNLGQQNMSVYAQNLLWEELPQTLLVTQFQDLIQRLKNTPPACLQRRVIGEDFVILKVDRVDNVRFDDPQQMVCGVLFDTDEVPIHLTHPYFSRGRSGAEHLLNVLLYSKVKVLFVAGRIRQSSTRLEILPSALVVENPDQTRQMLVPFLDDTHEDEMFHVEIDAGLPAENAVQNVCSEILTALGEAAMLGPDQARKSVDFGGLAARARDLSLTLPAQSLEAFASDDPPIWQALVIATLASQL